MSTTAALLKLPCILAVATSLHTTLTLPGTASKSERLAVSGVGSIIVDMGMMGSRASKTLFWILGAVEMAVIIANTQSASRSIGSILMKDGYRANHLGLTSWSVVGLGLILFGGWLRRECYRVMATQFTAALSIRKDHKLITTGPYGFVRHPSNSAVVAAYIGILLWFGSRGSWLRESGVLETTAGLAFFGSFLVFMGAFCLATITRMEREDRELRKVFNEQWDLWAQRVPYWLIPGVF